VRLAFGRLLGPGALCARVEPFDLGCRVDRAGRVIAKQPAQRNGSGTPALTTGIGPGRT